MGRAIQELPKCGAGPRHQQDEPERAEGADGRQQGRGALLWNLVTVRGRRYSRGRGRPTALCTRLLSADGHGLAPFYASGSASASGSTAAYESAAASPRRRSTSTWTSAVTAVVSCVSCERPRRGVGCGARDREPIARYNGGGPVVSAQFDRSGEYVVTGGDDGVRAGLAVNPKRQLAVLRGHTDGVIRSEIQPGRNADRDRLGRRQRATLAVAAPDSHRPLLASADGAAFAPNSRTSSSYAPGDAWERSGTSKRGRSSS